MQRLLNKVAVVTGGNSGIGKGIAKRFYQEGARVVIFGRNQTTLEQTKDEMPGILTVQGDVTETNDLKNLYQQTVAQFGKIDVLAVNSGVGERLPITAVTEDKFDYMVNTNYRGAYFTVKYALDFLNSPASIIFISSVAAHITLKNHSVYASTKAAISKLAKNLTNDLGSKQIRVNSISPGYIKTPIFDERLKTQPDYLKTREKNIPLQRIGTPEDIGNVALFLATDESSYVSGTDILVDGGYSSTFIEP